MQKRYKYSKRDMNKLIREWESSGLSQEKFLNQHKIAKSTFGYWRKKYLEEHSNRSRKETFIPVKISTDENPADNTGTIEIIYPNGVRLLCILSTQQVLLKQNLFICAIVKLTFVALIYY